MNAVFNNEKLCSKIKGFIEVGASIGEEVPHWEKAKVQNQIFIEPIDLLFNTLQDTASKQQHHPNVKCFNMALSDHDGIDEFHLATGSTCSSSLLNFHKDAVRIGGQTLQTSSIQKVKVRKLDTFVVEEELNLNDYNMLYLDVQGSEYDVIKGAEQFIKKFDMVFSEVNLIPLYEGVKLWPEFNQLMSSKNFRLVDFRHLEGSSKTQGEALYFNRNFKWS